MIGYEYRRRLAQSRLQAILDSEDTFLGKVVWYDKRKTFSSNLTSSNFVRNESPSANL